MNGGFYLPPVFIAFIEFELIKQCIQPQPIITHLNSMIIRSAITLVLFYSSFFVSAQVEQKKMYPLVIAFTSYGTGIPDKKPVIEFIRAFQKKNKIKKIKVDTIGPMGKEGEYNLALSLTELTKKQKTLFIQQIKKISKKTGDPGEIKYEENVSVDEPKNRKPPTPQKVIIE